MYLKVNPMLGEIGNLNCVNISGKFDTGHKVDNKALFKFLKDHIKKNTLKKEFSSKINEKVISEIVNELKVGKGIFCSKLISSIIKIMKKLWDLKLLIKL